MPEIYFPEEDSLFMVEILKSKIKKMRNSSEKKFFEMGPGSGINLETLKNLGIKKENIFSADINPNAVERCNSLGFNCIKSNLFSKVKGKYDVIFFNPPYLPEDKTNFEDKDSKIATTGGKKGNEIIMNFLKQAKKFLNKNGKIFLLISSFTGKINFENLGYKTETLMKKNLFFEKLFILELRTIQF